MESLKNIMNRPLSVVAAVLLVIGKATGAGAAAFIMMQMPVAKTLLVSASVLVLGAIVLAGLDWSLMLAEEKKKNSPLAREFDALVKKHGREKALSLLRQHNT